MRVERRLAPPPSCSTPRSSAELSRAAAIKARQAASLPPGLDPSGANARSIQARMRAKTAAALGQGSASRRGRRPRCARGAGRPARGRHDDTARHTRHDARTALAARRPDRRRRRGDATRSRVHGRLAFEGPASVLPRTRRASAMSAWIQTARRRQVRRRRRERAERHRASTRLPRRRTGTVAVVRCPGPGPPHAVADDDAQETSAEEGAERGERRRASRRGRRPARRAFIVRRSEQGMRPRSR